MEDTDARHSKDAQMDELPPTLIDLLSNQIVLHTTSPYLPIRSLLSVSASCKALRAIVLSFPEAFQYVDVSDTKPVTVGEAPIDYGGISWRAERMDESLTEAEFYGGRLRGIFNRLQHQDVLRNVSTLILDGLSVPADLVREVIAEDRFRVRILSIRQCKHLNERKLNQLLRYAVRSSRPAGTPLLRGLYIFGPKDITTKASSPHQNSRGKVRQPIASGVMSSEGAQIGAEWNQKSYDTISTQLSQPQDRWYASTRRVMAQPYSEWAETLGACEGIISFDAVLCRGPRHDPRRGKDYLPPKVATVALGPRGCESCRSCPEKAAIFGQDAGTRFPLLAPPPLHSSTVRSAQRPTPSKSASGLETGMPPLILRCEDCLRGRWCERCNKWWCEDCYHEPVSRAEPSEGLDVAGLMDAMSPPSGQGNVKVYFNVCVESCLRGELLPVVDGMWG